MKYGAASFYFNSEKRNLTVRKYDAFDLIQRHFSSKSLSIKIINLKLINTVYYYDNLAILCHLDILQIMLTYDV